MGLTISWGEEYSDWKFLDSTTGSWDSHMTRDLRTSWIVANSSPQQTDRNNVVRQSHCIALLALDLTNTISYGDSLLD
jgi:hypothetical protein